ncbi:unnamed protein product [Aphanomyces euteiches]|uniref:HSF-type DNA-binding domain-containing protein n=1 Tax=Aphanomyces euteiches TaxID=100861 RepID=A0A6G0X8D9_9STRA|nr:hypothetical protein Ae201684_007331 [Aphanomyces euteiches]KAH9081344.1 hypothetical protein LEN26_021335 [Aphanomyces euteiches]KAH9100704.1 hypothetical protein Ae201684P_006898 [Aphanomyces euteiches]KAH9103256.1 hypothetical protein AeMF1_020394 [Aphanomyces euteiches]KAH9143496.1 hypothetical protein AeRB84_012507 [Aphanomyces euteiches]
MTFDAVAPLFIRRLYSLLDEAPAKIVSWAPDGQSFVIYDVAGFATQVMPHYFGHQKLATFERQLDYFGFHKCQLPRDAMEMEYCHLDFQRGNLAGLATIRKRFKRDLDPDDRAVVDEIEESILQIKRHVEQNKESLRLLLDCLADLNQDDMPETTYSHLSPRGTHTMAPPPLYLGSKF